MGTYDVHLYCLSHTIHMGSQTEMIILLKLLLKGMEINYLKKSNNYLQFDILFNYDFDTV